MKKIEKIELLLLLGLIVLQFLTLQGIIPSLIFLFATISLALYFSPIKIIKILKEGVDYYNLAVTLLVSITIILSYAALQVRGNNYLSFVLLLLSITSWVLIFLWNKKRKTSNVYMLFLNMIILSGAYIY